VRLKRKRVYKRSSLKRKRTRTVHRKGSAPATLPHNAEESLQSSKPREHFHISEQTKYPIKIAHFLEKNDNDVATQVRDDGVINHVVCSPATQEFREDLNYHLLARLLRKKEEEVTPEERMRFAIPNGTMYAHKALRINYTSYDLLRPKAETLSDTPMRSLSVAQLLLRPYASMLSLSIM
jgi:hypothetical protein